MKINTNQNGKNSNEMIEFRTELEIISEKNIKLERRIKSRHKRYRR